MSGGETNPIAPMRVSFEAMSFQPSTAASRYEPGYEPPYSTETPYTEPAYSAERSYSAEPACQAAEADSSVSVANGEEGEGGERRVKSKQPTKEKTCLVCGDKALGYNFNAVSCESCKAFFRRNAAKEIRGRCEGQCEVTVESRSYCKKCRLAKCYAVGMKKDLILNDHQKQQRRQKIHENRLRRQGVPVPADDAFTRAEDEQAATHPPEPGTPPPDKQTTGLILKQEADPSQTHVLASAVDPRSLDGLSERGRSTLAEVMHAFQLSFDGPMERQPLAAPSSTDFLNMADTSVRRLVKMAKQLSAFRALGQEDQIALLKGAIVEVLILRSAKMFDASTMGWSVNKAGAQHTVMADSLSQTNRESLSFFEQYKHFAVSLLQATHRDNIVLMLMIVMAVLSPDRGAHTAGVERAQELYAEVLREYVAVRYPTEEHMFPRVLQKLADIRDLNESHTRMLMHMKVEELEPLIVEIFDIAS